MKPIIVFLSVISMLFQLPVNAQTATLNTAIDKIYSFNSMSYSQITHQKSPFTDEWSTLNYKATVSYNPKHDSLELFDYNDTRGYRSVYNGTQMITLDISNKTYTTAAGKQLNTYNTPYHWARLMKSMLALPAGQVLTLPDTVVDHTPCLHVARVLANAPGDRNIIDLYLDKKTYLPVFAREFLQGRMGKGNQVDSKVTTMITEYTYANYRTNAKETPIAAFVIPTDYKPEIKPALTSVGSKAPGWTLKDVNSNTVTSDSLNGRIVLLDFSFNECAACMLTVPVLNRLHEKYKGTNVSIYTINTSNTKASVINFAKKNNIVYPILLSGSKVSRSFGVSAYPSFILINKQGNIAASFEGTSKTLENELITQIDKLK